MADEKDLSKDEKAYGTGQPPFEHHDSDEISLRKGDLLAQEDVDPVLNAKMHLINNAIVRKWTMAIPGYTAVVRFSLIG